MVQKLIKAFSSLKLAVIILISLAVLIATGTIIESKYDAQAAQKLVYHTWMMYVVMGALALTLIAVMVDRWPWKKRHIPFILAHIGILILQAGSVVTARWGLDGTMRFGIGENNRYVVVPETQLQIWSSFDGDRYTKLLGNDVDFFLKHPQKYPLQLELPEGLFKVEDFEPYVIPSRKIVPADTGRTGAAIRFQVQNANVNTNEWLFQGKPGESVSNTMGLARFVLGPAPASPAAENVLYVTPDGPRHVQYLLTYKDPQKKSLKGRLQEGESFPTGWMGLEFRLIRYIEKAQEVVDLKKLERPTPLSTAAIQISYQGKRHWIQLNDVLKIFSENAVYIITYGSKRIDLGFGLQLKKFEVGRYQGTMRAATYSSLVTTPDGQDTLISMNEPLKYQGLTFYQASFQEGPDQQPIASILSVNYDPGRWIKYLGSLVLSLGVVWLFYNKRKAARAQAPSKGAL